MSDEFRAERACRASRLLLAALGVLVLFTAPANTAEQPLGDITFDRKGGDNTTPTAIFPHWVHRIRFKCYACHPAVFPMKRNSTEITMDAIQDGKFCGVCHNGQVAFQVTFETCNRCHRPR